jgi:hypothetical protein
MGSGQGLSKVKILQQLKRHMILHNFHHHLVLRLGILLFLPLLSWLLRLGEDEQQHRLQVRRF